MEGYEFHAFNLGAMEAPGHKEGMSGMMGFVGIMGEVDPFYL
jgi:hypothetical protein